MSAMGRCLDSVEADIKKSAPIVLDLRNSPGLDSRTVRDRICFMKNILREMQEAADCAPAQEKETRLASSISEPQKIDFHKMDKDAIQDFVTASVTVALEQLGVSSGEITYAKGSRIYGKWFTDAVAAGILRHVRGSSEKNATRWYSVADILSLRLSQRMAAKDTLGLIGKNV